MNHEPSPSIGDRRPLASRDTALARRACRALVARGVSPNAISVFGMFIGIAAGMALALPPILPAWERPLWLVAAVAIQLRLLCNLLDGMVAVESGRVSATGELFNEVPDRVADTAVLVGLGMACGQTLLGLATALLAMATAYVRALGKSLTGSSDFCGPMAKPHRMFLVTVVALYLGLAPHGWQPNLAGWRLPEGTLLLIAVGSGLTALRRLYRLSARLRANSP
jgi:phosphatidylglycerophosphate synthase